MNAFKSKDIVLICGNHTNAHTIVRNLPIIGFDGKVIIIRNEADPALVAERLNFNIELWKLSVEESENLPQLISDRFGQIDGNVYICFTNERYFHSFADWKREHRGDNMIFNFGEIDQITTILNRDLFYRFIADRQLAAVPKTISGTEDPFKVFGDAFVMRPKETWQNPNQREYVKLVYGRESFDKAASIYASRGVGGEELCFQEMLSIRNESNVSIAGWFDLNNQHLYCLRKRFQHPPGIGSGDVCELIEPPEGMMASAVAILTALKYKGPLEMEFVFDLNSNEYKVIEMNPRFWMQHGLLDVVSGRALISRNLNKEPLAVTPSQANKKYWVNTVQCLYHVLKFSFKPLGYYIRTDSWAPYTIFQAMWYAPLHVISKMRAPKWRT